jgi:hypothetical protein
VSNCLARVPRSCDEIGGSSTIQAKDFHYKKSRFPNPGLPHPRILLVFTLCLVPFGYFRTNTRVRVSSLSTRARGQGTLLASIPFAVVFYASTANEHKTMKTWEKTREQNLLRHKSGRYYARTFNNNKEIWKSLRTTHFSVTKARLAEFLREHREKQVDGLSAASAKMTFGEALKIHEQNQADDVTIKPTTRHYWKQVIVALQKSWPGLEGRELRRITKMDCNEWARRFRKLASPTRYNNTIAGLRHVFDVAIARRSRWRE